MITLNANGQKKCEWTKHSIYKAVNFRTVKKEKQGSTLCCLKNMIMKSDIVENK